MIDPSLQKDRAMLPRWRSFSVTTASQELGSLDNDKKRTITYHPEEDFIRAGEQWRTSPTLITAAEFVEAALVAGRANEASMAARRILKFDYDATPLLRHQASLLLIQAGLSAEVDQNLVPSKGAVAATWRRRTRLNSRDALAWVELSLAQITKGHREHAKRSMLGALSIAPNNRHVLRSAARMFFQLGDPERAHDLVARNPATRGDPWLLAAEIAFAEAASKSPRFLKQGIALMDAGGFAPRHITELAGAVATTEARDGSRKQAKRMFARSLTDPTGNARAQAEWASSHFGPGLIVTTEIGFGPELQEAKALKAFQNRDLHSILSASEGWTREEPTSARAFELGATTANILGEFAKAELMALEGFRLDPTRPALINCMAFALASQNKVDEASKFLKLPELKDGQQQMSGIAQANRGLIAFRKGDHVSGQRYYRLAIEQFRTMKMAQLAATGMLYLAKEALRAKLPEASDLLVEAKKAMPKQPSFETHYIQQSIEAAFDDFGSLNHP